MAPSAEDRELSSVVEISTPVASEETSKGAKELSAAEMKPIMDSRNADSVYFVPSIDQIGVSSIIDLVENKF